MSLKRLPFKSLSTLIGAHLSTEEDPQTQKLIDDLKVARRRGYLTKPELVSICRWKSARVIHQIRRNRASSVERVTRDAFKTQSERKKLELLTTLYGVGVPMASSILTLTNSQSYGVIDIRVWQLLYKMGAVHTNKKGVGFDFKSWSQYLIVLRQYAKKHHVGARDIGRTLFNVHTLYQRGTLYEYSKS